MSYEGTGRVMRGGVLGACIVAAIATLFPACSDETASNKNGHDDDCAINLFLISQSIQLSQDGWPGAFDDIRDKDGKPLLSWRVKMLVYLEQAPLFDEFHRDEPWDSPHNMKLLAKMPKAFRCPKDADPASTKTPYRVVSGPGTLFDGKGAAKLSGEQIPDGLSNTIMVFESSKAVPWTKPDSVSLDDGAASLANSHDGGAWAAFADGMVRFIPAGTPPTTVKAMLTPEGKESARADDLRVNEAARDLKRRADDFARRAFGGK